MKEANQINDNGLTLSTTSEVSADTFLDDAARASFTKTITQMKKLVNSVRNLAQHAESFFWQARGDSFSSASLSVVAPDTNFDVTGVNAAITCAMKICMAAYPMLDEILEKFSLICSLEHRPLGMGDGASPWLNNDKIDADAVGTFYVDTVIGICDELDGMLEKMREWNRNADGFDSIANIQKHYLSALIQMRNRATKLLYHVGPFWTPVICSFSPYIMNTEGATGSGSNVYPTHFSAIFMDTQSILITLYHNSEIIPFHEAFDIAAGKWLHDGVLVEGAYDRNSWAAAYTTMSNGEKVYRSEGGLVLVETAGDTGIDSGIYEVLEIGDRLILRNKLLRVHSTVTQKGAGIDDITFQFRFLRKRKEFYVGEGSPYDLIANVQYRADVQLFQGSDFTKSQRTNFMFIQGQNEHRSPLPIENNKEEIIREHVWKGYTESGTVPDVTPGALVSNLSEDILYVLDTTEIPAALGWTGRATCVDVAGNGGVYICGKFVNGSETADLLKLDHETNELEKVDLPGLEYCEIGGMIVTSHSVYLIGSFFDGLIWINEARYYPDSGEVYLQAYPFLNTRDRDIFVRGIGSLTIPGELHYIYLSGHLHYDANAVSSFSTKGLNKSNLVKIQSSEVLYTFDQYQEGIAFYSDLRIFIYDSSSDTTSLLRISPPQIATLDVSGKPKVLNGPNTRLLYGNDLYSFNRGAGTLLGTISSADEINSSAPATIDGVPSEVVVGKNITVNGETGIGYIFGLNRVIGTGLE